MGSHGKRFHEKKRFYYGAIIFLGIASILYLESQKSSESQVECEHAPSPGGAQQSASGSKAYTTERRVEEKRQFEAQVKKLEAAEKKSAKLTEEIKKLRESQQERTSSASNPPPPPSEPPVKNAGLSGSSGGQNKKWLAQADTYYNIPLMNEKEALDINEQNLKHLEEQILGRVYFAPFTKNDETTYVSAQEKCLEMSTEDTVEDKHVMKAHIQPNTAVQLCTNQEMHIALMAGKEESERGFIADVFTEGPSRPSPCPSPCPSPLSSSLISTHQPKP